MELISGLFIHSIEISFRVVKFLFFFFFFIICNTLRAMTLMEQGLVVIDISHTTEDKESSAYSAHFSPHVSPTKNGSRDTIPLTLTVRGTAVFLTKRPNLINLRTLR